MKPKKKEKRPYVNLLQAIKQERIKKKISQKEIIPIKYNDKGEKVEGLTQSSYRQIEDGQTYLTIDRLSEICNKLDLNMFDLLRKDFDDKTLNRINHYFEMNESWFRIVESMIIKFRGDLDECISPKYEAHKPLSQRVEELAIKYQDIINAIDLFKLGKLPEKK